MTYRYYESQAEGETMFNIGDYNLSLESKKEKYPGLIVRKLSISKQGQETRCVTHVQETKWEDNKAPDFNNSDDQAH